MAAQIFQQRIGLLHARLKIDPSGPLRLTPFSPAGVELGRKVGCRARSDVLPYHLQSDPSEAVVVSIFAS